MPYVNICNVNVQTYIIYTTPPQPEEASRSNALTRA